MRIPRYRYKPRKYEIPKYRDKEIKLPRYRHTHENNVLDRPKMAPKLAKMAPRWHQVRPISPQDRPR